MKHLHKTGLILWLIAAAAALGACVNNDHTPMPWMGAWAMESMTVDGQPAPDIDPEMTMWEFQNNIVRITRQGSHQTLANVCWGTWAVTDRTLTLDYTHSATNIPAGTGEYSAPTWLMMPANSVMQLDILQLDNRKIRLQYQTPQGETVVYTLRKTW